MTNRNNLVVVGGGLAGWLTALYAKKVFPNKNITVVASSEIGILGAGEGTTPSFIPLLDFLEIPVSQIIIKCKATIKNGVRFENFSEKNLDYFHPFTVPSDTFHKALRPSGFDTPNVPVATLYEYFHNKSMYTSDFVGKLSLENKVPFVIDDQVEVMVDPSNQFFQIAEVGLHFDAALIAEFLKNVAISRDIKYIDNEVVSFKQDDQGNVVSLICKDQQEVDCDFVFDCSGFHRVVTGKFFESKWISHSKYLPMKKAMPFFIHDRQPWPYTSAKDELDQKMGFETEIIKVIDFEPGYFKNPWQKNVLAIGLAFGFTEPMEASSVWSFTRNLERFFEDQNNLYCDGQIVRDKYNYYAEKEAEEIKDFIYLHYLTDKKNNDFWKNFLINNSVPPFIEELLEINKYRPPYIYESYNTMYAYACHIIMFGNNIVDKELILSYCLKNSFNKIDPFQYEEILKLQNLTVKDCLTLEEFLDKNLMYK
jgi:tryptophan halogenase